MESLQGDGFEEVAPSVFVADILPRELCDKVLLEFSSSPQWRQGGVATAKKNEAGMNDIVGIIDTTRRNAYSIRLRRPDLDAKPKTAECLSIVQGKVGAFASAEFGLDFKEFGGVEIVRYPQGGMFSVHSDTHVGNSHRAFSVIIYLNDDFDGGATSFPDLHYECQPRAGRVSVFLSTELHCGSPVTRGEKNIIVFFGFFPGSAGKEA